jgi:hypothetical protein
MVVGDMDRAGADPDGGERMRRRRRGKCDMQEGGREGVREREVYYITTTHLDTDEDDGEDAEEDHGRATDDRDDDKTVERHGGKDTRATKSKS